MALATYTDLQTSVAGFLDRTDLTAVIPDFITLAESWINGETGLNLRTVESDQTLAVSTGSRFAPLPASFREAQTLWQVWPDTGARVALRSIPPELMTVNTINSIPTAWGIDGTNVCFDCPLSSSTAYSYVLRQIGGVTLSASAPTNLVLTNYPNVYLYGALREGADYLRDDDALQKWEGRYQAALAAAKLKEGRAKSLVTLSTEPGILTYTGRRASFNVNRGW